jgi:hypothetical protein
VPSDPSTFLYKLASAFATAEGAFVKGSLPNTDNNPGDLRLAPWVQNPVIQHGFWKPTTLAQGVAGLYHQLALDIARGWSLRQLVYSYAPPSDGNNSENYLMETARRVCLNPTTDLDTPLQNFLLPLVVIP